MGGRAVIATGRALAAIGPADEAIQNVGAAEFHRAAAEQV
jgi:hypothetical protein